MADTKAGRRLSDITRGDDPAAMALLPKTSHDATTAPTAVRWCGTAPDGQRRIHITRRPRSLPAGPRPLAPVARGADAIRRFVGCC